MHEFEEIYKDNYEIVYKYLIVLTHNADISEELTQETFYKAIKNIHSFQGKSKLSTWLCQIAKNLWLNELKKKAKIKEIDNSNAVVTEYDTYFENEEKINLYRNIQNLDVKTRDVMYLRLSRRIKFQGDRSNYE